MPGIPDIVGRTKECPRAFRILGDKVDTRYIPGLLGESNYSTPYSFNHRWVYNIHEPNADQGSSRCDAVEHGGCARG